MKYLVVKIKRVGTNRITTPDVTDFVPSVVEIARIPILEEAQKAYEAAKKQDDVLGVYLGTILKEIDL